MAASTQPGRRSRIRLQLAIAVTLILVAFLQPRVKSWLNDAPATPSTDQQSLPSPTSDDEDQRIELPPNLSERPTGDAGDDQQNAVRGPAEPSSSGATEAREPVDDGSPGKLLLVADDVFRSTAGLEYVPGSRDGHRLKHIMKHARDDQSKPVHGVFSGDRDDILRWIDLAYIRAQKGGRDVRKEQQNRRIAWTVRMNDAIGFVGGQNGARKGHPDCRYLRLVVEEDKRTVVTAYPVSSF